MRSAVRKTLALVLFCLVAGLGSGPVGADLPVVRAEDFAADAANAQEQELAMLVAVTREGCPYCRLLLRDVLGPMSRSGEYTEQVLIRELMIEPDEPVVDFDGGRVSSANVARRYGVGITPTVLLLDPRGELLHEPLVGINTPELYGHYLDRAIQAGRAKMALDRSAGPAGEY